MALHILKHYGTVFQTAILIITLRNLLYKLDESTLFVV